MTLHDLTTRFGVDVVAAALDLKPRTLAGKRCGDTALTVDDLHKLQTHYPQFDMRATVAEIGTVREGKKNGTHRSTWSGRDRRKNNRPPGR